MFNAQETFNQVYLGLKSQGFQRSVSGQNESCQYRGPNGLKCAAGWIIPDEMYSPSLEGQAVIEQKHPNAVTKLVMKLGYDVFTLDSLQSIHDNAFDSDDVERALLEYAEDNDLTIPE